MAQGSIMFHGLIHPETWCEIQSNTGIAIYMSIKQTADDHSYIIKTKTLGEQVKGAGVDELTRLQQRINAQHRRVDELIQHS
jgi:hypothetical protein